MELKIGSLFDGSGGFPFAASLCGIEPTWASEVEPYPIAVTRSRFPGMKHLGNVTGIKGGEIEPVDIITFGSPCQDLSVAGKRAGLKHEANGDEETTRSGLFMEAVRIIKEMREATDGKYPTFALWENVPGAFSSNKGEDFRTVCEELIKIVEPSAVMPAVPAKGWPYADSYSGDGWSLAYRVFDAQYWGKTIIDRDSGTVLQMGTPQRRRRIHLVLDLRGERAGEVLFEREGLCRDYPESGAAWQATAGDASYRSGTDDREGEGFDGYNGDLTGVVSATLGVNCGMSTGRNGVIEYQVDKESPYTLEIRSGCDGGGKCALSQTDLSATLSTRNDQYLFQPVSILDSIGGQAERGWEGEVAPCLKASHYKFAPVVCYDARGNGDGEIVSTITGDHESRITDYTSVVCEPIAFAQNQRDEVRILGDKAGACQAQPGMKQQTFIAQPTYCLQGNGIDRADTAGCNGKGWTEDVSYTLNTIDRPAVAYGVETFHCSTEEEKVPTLKARDWKDPNVVVYADEQPIVFDKEAYNSGANATGGHYIAEGGPAPALRTEHPPGVCVRYIVRRLTPTECARLQGFPDKWGHPDPKEGFTHEEYRFWLEVRNTHAAINGKAVKEYTKQQMLTWYKKLHTDSAEYKMWGNGIALPPALYCMQGMAEALTHR